MSDLRTEIIKIAHEIPGLRKHLVPILREAAGKGTFEDFVKGRTFRNPSTGNKVQFKSLPAGEQKKLREHWAEASARGTDEDKTYEVRKPIEGYNLEIVGDNEKRAAYVHKKMKEGIDKTTDICVVFPPVCEGNLGITRDNMPQIMDKSVKALLASKDPAEQKKGKAAVEAGASADDDKPIMDHFLDGLKKKGVKIAKKKVPVGDLKATQREIKAKKTFGMADAYYKGEFDPAKGVEIIISSDNHILDGHHRYAALLLADPTAEMHVVQVDIPMKEFLEKSFKQPGVFRADLQDNVIPKDTPLDLSGGKTKK
ncbi:MAG: hypothetical protein WC824_06590 [Bacteroidota bacterium]|jgi:hypothetical protein